MTFLDTADQYGPFTNEYLVGKAPGRPSRSGRVGDQGRPCRGRCTQGRTAKRPSGTPDGRACDASLPAAGCGPCRPVSVAPGRSGGTAGGTVGGAMAELVVQGKATAISGCPRSVLRRSSRHTPSIRWLPCSPKLSLWTRNALDDVPVVLCCRRYRFPGVLSVGPRFF